MTVLFDDEDALTDWLLSEGIVVASAILPAGYWGLYEPERRRILVRAGMPAYFRYPALLHEAHHYVAGHWGHQSDAVEQRINKAVALHLINPAEYALAEAELGWNSGGIAAALELPRWVVQAYRRHLQSTLQTHA